MRNKKPEVRRCTECNCKLSVYNQNTICHACKERLHRGGMLGARSLMPLPLSGGVTKRMFGPKPKKLRKRRQKANQES